MLGEKGTEAGDRYADKVSTARPPGALPSAAALRSYIYTADKPLARAVTHSLIVVKSASGQPGPILPIVPLISV